MTLASGAFAQTLECSVDAWHDQCPFAKKYTFEDLMEPCFLTLKVMLKDGLRTPFCDREKLAEG